MLNKNTYVITTVKLIKLVFKIDSDFSMTLYNANHQLVRVDT